MKVGLTWYLILLLYGRGWGKKLTYVLGFAKDGVCDVTRRYTHQYDTLLLRRTDAPGKVTNIASAFESLACNAPCFTLVPEHMLYPERFLSQQIRALDQHLRGRNGVTEVRGRELDRRARVEEVELLINIHLGEILQAQ